jgi:type IX secretion system PorP/SprF family membrane protein
VYINTAYRNQWPGLAGNFVTYYVGADAYIKKLKTGVGFNYVDDRATQGTIKADRYSVQLSPKFIIKNKHRVSIALEAAYVQVEIDPSKFSIANFYSGGYNNVLNPNLNLLYSSKVHYFDYNCSILLENKLGNAGFVYSHIFQPNQSFNKLSESPLPTKFSLHATTKQFNLSSTNLLKIKMGLLAMRQASFNFLMLSATTSYKAFEVLTGFRRNDIIVGAGIQKKHFRFSYSYDLNIGIIKNSQGSHELNMAYRFGKQ